MRDACKASLKGKLAVEKLDLGAEQPHVLPEHLREADRKIQAGREHAAVPGGDGRDPGVKQVIGK